jgi:SAM-dependent methyltransferase
MPTRLQLVEVRACPVCGARDVRRSFQAADLLHALPGMFFIRRCAECGTAYQSPRVADSDLPRCYPADYFTLRSPTCGKEPAVERLAAGLRARLRAAIIDAVRAEIRPGALGWLGLLAARSRALRERAFYPVIQDFHADIDELIPRSPPSGAALDVGCGAGHQMEALSRLGWRVEGVEWDPRVATHANARTGFSVRVGDFRQVAAGGDAFDLILLHHVLEHVADPLSALSTVRQALTSTGRAVIVLPNPDSVGARLNGPSWLHWDVPRHLVLPPPKALSGLAARAGLQILSLRTTSRRATIDLATSRVLGRGEQLSSRNLGPRSRERLIATLESLLVALGVRCGEETIAVMGRMRR